MILEIPITVIDPETFEARRVMALVNTATGETSHLPIHVDILVEEEPDG